MSEVQKIKKVKKSKEAQQLLQSMKDTIAQFQTQAEKTVFILLPEQVKELDKIATLEYLQPQYDEELMRKFQDLQDVKKPFVDESVKQAKLIIQPTAQFLEVEQTMNTMVQKLQTMVTQIRRSVETMQWRRRTSRQEEIQRAVIAQLDVTMQNLQQVTNLFIGYHEARSDIVYSIQKYSCIDYFHLLPCLEQKLCRALRGFVSDFRIHLLMLYELLTINYDNILSPDTAKQAGGYSGFM